MIKVEYSCPVIDDPDKRCPHFEECLKNGVKGKCLLTKAEMIKRKNYITRFERRLKRM